MYKKTLAVMICTALLTVPAESKAQELQEGLVEVFETVLTHNPDIQSALSSIQSSEGKHLQAGFRPNPEVTVELENFGGKDALSGMESAEITLGIEQEIEIAGKRRNRLAVTNYGLDLSKQEAVSNIIATIALAHQSYADYAIALEHLALAEKRLKLAEKTHEAVKKRVKAAAASEIQHTKADIEQKAAVIKKAKAVEQLASVRARLERVLATDIGMLNQEVDIFSVSLEIPGKEALMKAVNSLPQKEILKLRKLQAKSNLYLAKSYAVPNPTVGLGVRRFNDTDNNALLATLSIPIPVFDRNQGNIASARAEVAKAENEEKSGILSLREASEKVYAHATGALQEVRTYQSDIIPSARRAYEQAAEGYNTGRFSFLELLDAQRTLYEMQEAHLDSLSKLHQAKAQIDFLMGTNIALISNKISMNSGENK